MKAKTNAYPSKTTLNLAMRQKNPLSPVKVIPLVLCLAVLAAGFSKFGVADRLNEVSKAQAQLAAVQQQKDALEQAVANYDEVLEEYSRYSVNWMTEEEQATVPRTDLLDLLEAELIPYGQVRSIRINGNLLSAEMGGLTLEDTSRIVQRLYQLPEVTNVAVYTASTETEPGSLQAAVSMVITTALVQEGGTEQ